MCVKEKKQTKNRLNSKFKRVTDFTTASEQITCFHLFEIHTINLSRSDKKLAC